LVQNESLQKQNKVDETTEPRMFPESKNLERRLHCMLLIPEKVSNLRLCSQIKPFQVSCLLLDVSLKVLLLGDVSWRFWLWDIQSNR
jgi:hypothetical protein